MDHPKNQPRIVWSTGLPGLSKKSGASEKKEKRHKSPPHRYSTHLHMRWKVLFRHWLWILCACSIYRVHWSSMCTNPFRNCKSRRQCLMVPHDGRNFSTKKTGNFRHTEVQQRFVFLVARFKRSPKCCVVTPSFTQITRQLRNPNIFWAPLPPH